MLLAIDIGNTQINIGVFKENNLLSVNRIDTDTDRTKDQYAVEIDGILNLEKIDIKDIDGVIICSVVPLLTKILSRTIFKLIGIQAIIVDPLTQTELKIVNIEEPSTIGADLIAGCVAAKHICNGPCIVIDLGTATTISTLNSNKAMIGTVILSGPATSLNSLISKTALLSAVSIKTPNKVLGTNTIDCLRSGYIYGTASMIDGMCARIEKEIGSKCNIIATGGLAPQIIPQCNYNINLYNNLVLEGLKILYQCYK